MAVSSSFGDLKKINVPLWHVVQFALMVTAVTWTASHFAQAFETRDNELQWQLDANGRVISAHSSKDMHEGARASFQLIAEEQQQVSDDVKKLGSDVRLLRAAEEAERQRFEDYTERAEKDNDELKEDLRRVQRSVDALLRAGGIPPVNTGMGD